MLKPTPKNLALAAFILALATIAGALGSQFIGGLVPCELCYQQRWPYYIGVPILAVTLYLWDRTAPIAPAILSAAVALIFVWGAWMAGYHAGVEWRFWPGPTGCTGLGESLSMDQFADLNSSRVVPCDIPQIRILGLSMAGWNAVVSVLLVGLLATAAARQARR
jgi:disulfide bond formation protein DsbB